MNLNKYKGVIRLVLSKHVGNAASQVTDELLHSLELAQVISGEIEPDAPVKTSVSIETYRPTQIPSKDPFQGAILLSSAPPVADASESGAEDDVDYWETKPGKGDGTNRLEAKLRSVLPQSITLKLPNIEIPLELVLGVGSPGIRFVHVNYTIAGDPLGPRYTVMTSQKEIDPEVILKDITTQAAAIYSAEKRTIQPRAVNPVAPPTNQELESMLRRDRLAQQPNDGLSGDDARRASEDAKAWSQNRSTSPRWQ